LTAQLRKHQLTYKLKEPGEIQAFLFLNLKNTLNLFMTKPEALAGLFENGAQHKCKHPIWKDIFNFYIMNTGDKSVKICCSTCHNKVLRWLRS